MTYIATQADVDDGHVVNSANSTGTPPGATLALPAQSAAQTPAAVRTPSIAVQKLVRSLVDANGDGVHDEGDHMDWTFIVTNTGNVTLWDIRVLDPKLAAAGVSITCETVTLAPGQRTLCTSGWYVISASDQAARVVRNVASASGSTLNCSDCLVRSTEVSSTDAETSTPLSAVPTSLALTGTVVMPVLWVGCAVLGLGLLLLVLARRRKRRDGESGC